MKTVTLQNTISFRLNIFSRQSPVSWHNRLKRYQPPANPPVYMVGKLTLRLGRDLSLRLGRLWVDMAN